MHETIVIRIRNYMALLGTNFFSARIHSKLTFTPTTYPGKKIRVEIKATLPTIEGVWPTIQLRGIDVRN